MASDTLIDAELPLSKSGTTDNSAVNQSGLPCAHMRPTSPLYKTDRLTAGTLMIRMLLERWLEVRGVKESLTWGAAKRKSPTGVAA